MARDGFHERKTESCEGCQIEDRVNALGQPRYNPEYGFRLTEGCAGCGGTGRTPAENKRDPYDTGRGAHELQASA